MPVSDFHSMVRIDTEKQRQRKRIICKLIKIPLASVVNFHFFFLRGEVELRPSTFIITVNSTGYMIMWLEFRSKGQSSARVFNTMTAGMKDRAPVHGKS